MKPLLLTITALFLTSCAFGQPAPPTPVLLPTPGAGGLAASLPLYAVERADVIQDATFPGAVRQASIQDIFFGATGRVKEIYVRSGDDVLVDQTLAELDMRDLEFDLQKAQLDLKLAEQRAVDTDIDFRFEQLARQIELQRAKLRLAQFQANPSSASADIAIQELAVKQAELALQQMESGVGLEVQTALDKARIDLRAIQAALGDATITAPFAGQVLLYDVLEKGKVVQAFTPVASIVDPESVIVESNLVPADLESLSEGMPVTIRVVGPLTAELPGVITSLPQPFGTGAGRTVRITPEGEDVLSLLRPGASVEVTAVVARIEDVPSLPLEAIQGFQDNYFVCVCATAPRRRSPWASLAPNA